jgi:hypothetical protein
MEFRAERVDISKQFPISQFLSSGKGTVLSYRTITLLMKVVQGTVSHDFCLQFFS